MKVNFKHNEYCDGVLLSGNNLNNLIIVCSKCKSFASVQKFVWTCPKCHKHFNCCDTRTFSINENEKLEKDEFECDNYDDNDNEYNEDLNINISKQAFNLNSINGTFWLSVK